MSSQAQPEMVTGVVTEVREGHQLDRAALARFLAGRLPGLESGAAEDLKVRQFEGGQSNPTYLLETPAGQFVLRKKPSGQLLASAHMVEREARILLALHGSKVPVPEVLVSSEDSSIVGTPFFIMSYVQGRILRDPALPGMSKSERALIYANAIETMANLHEVDWAVRGLTGFGKPQGYVARQISRWSQQYLASKLHETPAMDWLLKWLPERTPAPAEEGAAAIVHGDLRLDNLILAPDSPRVLAVIDWELSTLGDPFTELAYFCMPHFLPQGNSGLRGLVGVDGKRLGIPTVEEVVHNYCTHRGVPVPPPERFRFHLAFSMFRMAAIVAGIDKRNQQGNASSQSASAYAAQVDLFAEAGRRAAESSGA